MAYEPPDWGQQLRKKDVHQAYTSIVTFLDRCASVTEAPEYGNLTIHEPGKFSPPGYQHEPFVATAIEAFGAGDRQVGVRMFPDTGYAEYKHEWQVPSHAIDRAIEVVAAGPPSASKTVPPISLSLAWTFRLVDLHSGNLLPPVAPQSRLHLFLATAPSANFELNFPFERPDAAFLEYLQALRSYLPVHLAKSRFRQLVPTASGTTYARRKIDPGLFDGL